MARDIIRAGLLKRGFPEHIADGILGNISVESGFDPGINETNPVVAGSRGGFGLFQHTGPRRRELEAFAQSQGRPVNDIDLQLDFAAQELMTTERKAGEALRGAKTAEDAARIFSEKFLRPGVPHLDRRIAAATGGQVSRAASPQQQLNGGTMGREPTQRQGLLGGLLSEDKRDRLIAGLEGLTLNPNVALQQSALQGIERRADDRQTSQQANRTSEFLRQRGRDDLADAVLSGGIDPKSAVSAALSPEQADNVVVNNRLVNRNTGDIVADFSSSEDGVPAAVKALQIRADAGGLKPGTPEYGEFMLRGGAEKGFSLQVGSDGQISMAQGGATLKPLTESESKSTTFAVRAQGALPILDANDSELVSRANRVAELDPTGLARELQSPEFQLAKQAGDEFLQAILRKDTGAAITEQEQALYGKTYLPQPGDDERVILQKRQSRKRALEALKAGMSPTAIIAQERGLEKSGGAASNDTGNISVDPGLLEFMTPEERALFE